MSGRDELTISRLPLDPEWDEFVDRVSGGGHLQTSRWSKFKSETGWLPLRLQLRSRGALVGGCQFLVRRFPIGAIAYCPRGPLALDRDSEIASRVLDAVGPLALRERVLFVKVQPPPGGEAIEALLRDRGYVKSTLPAAHVATLRIDLTKTPDEILAEARDDKRRNIRRGERDGLEVRRGTAEDIPVLAMLLAETGKRRKRQGNAFAPYPAEQYGKLVQLFDGRAQLFLADYDGEPVAAEFVLAWGDTAVGLMAASSERYRHNQLLLWNVIQWAKRAGYRYFDFDGIEESIARAKLEAHDLPEPARRGNTAYKLSWGGEVVIYPAAYDRSFHRLLIWPTRLLQRANPTDLTNLRFIRRLRGRTDV